MVYPALLPLVRTPRLPAVDSIDALAELNGLSVSPKDEIWFVRVCHHISKAVFLPLCVRAAVRHNCAL